MIKYLGLEPYNARYTLQLTDWTTRAFKQRNVPYEVIEGQTLDTTQTISVGQVLDAHGRAYYAMSQMMEVVKQMREGRISGSDILFFEDMFHPGIESLPYIMDQIPTDQRPKVFVRCLAQTIDPDDFVHVWGMEKWMAHFERMVGEFATVLATNEEMVAHMKIAGWTAPIYNIAGLAFSADEVRERATPKLWCERQLDVVFAARFDQEKQPHFFMDLAEKLSHEGHNVTILSGGPLRSNDPSAVERARRLAADGVLTVAENLPKDAYYAYIANAKVLFNCALQDWVSNTVSEADALGCNVVYPAYRSFPETFMNDHSRLYVPWSLEDAHAKVKVALGQPSPRQGSIAQWNSKTVDRCIDIMLGLGELWNRSGKNYRSFVNSQ